MRIMLAKIANHAATRVSRGDKVMDLGAALDVAIGVIFVYLLISLLVTALNEYVSSWLDQRSAFLLERIEALLSNGSKTWSAEMSGLWNHPIIGALKSRQPTDSPDVSRRDLKRNAPSYIPSPTFALALIDMLKSGGTAQATLADIKANVLLLTNAPLKAALLPLIDAASGDLQTFQNSVAAWFDAAMDRASGAYKRWAHVVTFWLGIGLAVAFNVNTLTLIDDLWRDPVTRAGLVQQADKIQPPTPPAAGAPPSLTPVQQAAQQITDLSAQLPLPIGWTGQRLCGLNVSAPQSPACLQPAPSGWALVGAWIQTIIGLAITGLAVSLGAPFWFGVLQNVTNIRAAGVKPAREDGSRPK